MGATSMGAPRSDVNTSTPKRNRMPASMAATTACGMRSMSAEKSPVAPNTVMAMPASRKAPMASG